MKILFLHRTRGEGVEGVHIRGMVQGFRSLGHQVEMVCPPGVDPETPAPSWLGRLWRRVCAHTPELCFEIMELTYNIFLLGRLARSLRGHPWDMTYERYAFFNFAGAMVSRLRRVPLALEVNYTTTRTLVRGRSRLLLPLARAIEGWVFKQARCIAAVSTPLVEELISRGVPRERIVLTPNAVGGEWLLRAPAGGAVREHLKLNGRRVIGFVGGFYPWHGLDFFLEAIFPLLNDNRESCLLLVGSGPLMEPVRRQVIARGLEDRVVLTGPVPHEELCRYIDAMDICVLPHSNEYGSPMKLLEYMGRGKPVVAPGVAPVCDIVVHGRVGLLFYPGDGAGLREAIALLLKDEEYRDRLGRAARQSVVEGHTWFHRAESVLSPMKGAGRPATVARERG